MDDTTSHPCIGPGFLCLQLLPSGGVALVRAQTNPPEHQHPPGGRSAESTLILAKQFEDSALAEALVRLELEHQGFKAPRGSNVFACSTEIAVASVTAVEARLDSSETEVDSTRLTAAAVQTLDQSNPTPAELLDALNALEYALTLGSPLAGYLGAQTALELAGRPHLSPLQEDRLTKQAVRLYTASGESGVARAWADLAVLRHHQHNENASKSCWSFYFSAFKDVSPPSEELHYLAELLFSHYYSQGCAEDELLFLKNNKIAVLAGLTRYPKELEYHLWLKKHAWTPMDFLIEKFRLPLLGFAGLAGLYVVNPGWAFGVLACGIGYYWLKKRTK
jgi:hypothetical protein